MTSKGFSTNYNKMIAFIIIILIILLSFKVYWHLKLRDFTYLMDNENLSAQEEVKIYRYGSYPFKTYEVKVYDKEDIQKLIDLIQSIKVRRYYIGDGELYYEGHIDYISFNNGKRIVSMRIIGNKFIKVRRFPNDFEYEYELHRISGDIDMSIIDRIVEKENLEKIK